MKRETLSVTGMSCSGCERNVENALKNLGSVTRVEADHEDATVEIVAEDDVEDDELYGAIEQAGYDVAV